MIQTHRPAFSMITAMFVVVIMSSITAMVMGTASKIVQSTVGQYQREQAMLWAKSYTEFAVMTVMANDRDLNDCIETINADVDTPLIGQGYRILTKISFVGNQNQTDTCSDDSVFSDEVTTAQSPLNVIVDVYVSYREISHPDILNAPWISYHKRTLQKI